MDITTLHVVIEDNARWPAQVWEHDGDEPIALFQNVGDAHAFVEAMYIPQCLSNVYKPVIK